VLLVLLGILIVPIFGRPENLLSGENPLLSNYPYFIECGGQGNESAAAISYKADVSISSNERCVWVIRVPDALTYTLQVLSLGLQTSRDIGITATCILGTSTALTHTSINATGTINLGAMCPILILSFFSGENVLDSRGFVMFYTAVSGTHGISASSENYVFTDPEGHVRHPPSVEQNYGNNEVSTFVFTPPNNVYNPSRRTLVTYSLDSLEILNCNDALRLYRFNPVSGWTHGAVSGDDYLCGNIIFKSWSSDEMMLFIFRSSPSVVGRGFHLTHTDLSVI